MSSQTALEAQSRGLRANHSNRLQEMSWNILRHNMVDLYGIDVSSHHEKVLRFMLRDFALLTTGLKTGRVAWPLSPGSGKTQSIVAFIMAVDHLKLVSPDTEKLYPVMVTSSRVQSLCELLDDLQKLGAVPEIGTSWVSITEYGAGSFGLLYSEPNKEATRPVSPNAEDAQFLFTTHARVRRARDESVTPRFDIRLLAQWRGVPRMVFYDESLLATDHWSIPKVNLFAALKSLDEYVVGHNNDDRNQQLRLDAVRCLQGECLPLLRTELEEQVAENRAPRLVYFPDRDYARFRKVLKPLRRIPETIFDLLDIAHRPLRVVPDKLGMSEGAFISFQIAIPAELDRVVCLDASYLIRSLCLADTTMTLGENHPALNKPQQSCHNIEGHIIKHGGGRNGIERGILGNRKILQEVVAIVKAIPPEERVLIVTHKDRAGSENRYFRVRIRDHFEAALKDAGIDLGRISWLTWGRETASNVYRDIPNVILAGVLHRSEWDLLGAFLGQTRDLQRTLTPQDIADLSISESTHHAYQAIYRGSCRKGKPMKFWIFYEHPRRMMDQLSRHMPGVKWPQYKNSVLPESTEKRQPLSEAIVNYLNALPATVTDVSCQKLREDMKLYQCERKTFQRAVDLALRSVPWARRAKSVARAPEGRSLASRG